MKIPHGHFSITKDNKIITIKYYESWNIEAVKIFFKAYKEKINEWEFEKFVILSDLTHYTGGTPEAMEYFHQITQWAISKGQIARAVIADSEYKKFTIKKIDKDKVDMPTLMCNSKEEALEWFKQFEV